jgi:hypothetical protein
VLVPPGAEPIVRARRIAYGCGDDGALLDPGAHLVIAHEADRAVRHRERGHPVVRTGGGRAVGQGRVLLAELEVFESRWERELGTRRHQLSVPTPTAVAVDAGGRFRRVLTGLDAGQSRQRWGEGRTGQRRAFQEVAPGL